MSKVSPPKNVLIVYNYIAHYRIPIFNLLSKSVSPHYRVISGIKAEIPIKTANTSLSKESVEKGGINWKIVKNFWFFKYFLWQNGVIKEVKKDEYNTIIFLGNMYYVSTWLASYVAKKYNKKVIFWTHGFIREERNIQGYLRKTFYKLADEILTYGHRAKRILIEKGFKDENIRVVYNSLDYNFQQKIINESKGNEELLLFEDNNIPSFGFIGRLTKQKEIPLLIDVLFDIHQSDTKVNLLIIGDGDVKDELISKVIKLGLEKHVVFYGACYDEHKIFSLLNSIKVIVSPGEVGLTAIHALTYGIPVITHNRFDKQMPEYECIIPDKTGDFFDYDNARESLKDTLEKWLFNKEEEDINKNCKEVIEKYYNPLVQKRIFDEVV